MKKLFTFLLMITLTFSLVACKKDTDLPLTPLEPSIPGVVDPEPDLSVEEEVLKILTNMNFEDLLNNNTNLKASVNIKEFITPVDEEITPIGLKLNNINVSINFESNFKEFESSKFKLDILITIDDVILIGYDDGEYAETPFYERLSIHQQFVLLNNNIYSSMEAFIYDNGSDEESTPNELKGTLDFLLMFMGGFLPEEVKPYLDSIKASTPIFENKKEVIKDVFTNEIHLSMHETLQGLQFIMKTLITLDLLENSMLDMEVVDNGVKFNNKLENEVPMLGNVEVLLEVKDKKFSSLKGKVEFSVDEVNNSIFEFSLSTNNETIFDTIENIDDYIEVEVLTLETTILDLISKLPTENPL